MKQWLVIGLLVCLAAMFSLGCGEEQKQPDKKEVIPSKEDLKKAIKPEEKKEEIKSEEKKEETKGDEGKKEEGKKEEKKEGPK